MPTATDLVTDLPADFEVFGQAVATSLADLLGGASGYILSKASAADMDFAWIANDQGDITGVTATTPLTGGGTSGAITVGIQDALTTQKGAVQLSDSTSTTSSILAATPTAVKSAYDLANGAIAKSIVDAKGDLIAATADNTVSRLAIGTNAQVLTADSTEATGMKWATPATPSSGLTLITTLSPSAVSVVNADSIFSATYDNYLIQISVTQSANAVLTSQLRSGGSNLTTSTYVTDTTSSTAGTNASWTLSDNTGSGNQVVLSWVIYSPALAAKTFGVANRMADVDNVALAEGFIETTATARDGLNVAVSAGTFTGKIRIYGMAN